MVDVQGGDSNINQVLNVNKVNKIASCPNIHELSKTQNFFQESSVSVDTIAPENKHSKYKQMYEDLVSTIEVEKLAWNEKRLLLSEEILKYKEDALKNKKDLETIVMRYATSEKAVLDCKKENAKLTKQISDLQKEKLNLIKRVQVADSDKSSLISQVSIKDKERSKLVSEINALNENLHSRDVKIKWLQNKLKTSNDSLQEYEAKLNDNITLLGKSKDQLRKLEENNLILSQEHENNEAELRNQLETLQFSTELTFVRSLESERDDLKTKLQTLFAENNTLSMKLQTLTNDKAQSDKLIESLNQEVISLRNELFDYENCLAKVKQLEDKFNKELSQNEQLSKENTELSSELNSISQKLEQAISRNGELAERSVHLQSELTAVLSERDLLKESQMSSENIVENIKKELNAKLTSLTQENETKRKEIQLLANKLAVKAKKEESLKSDLSFAENEILILKKKHEQSVKEMSREVNSLYRKLNSVSKESLVDSENGSSSSLNIDEEKYQVIKTPSPNSYESSCIEKIATLQNTLANKVERIDLLEDTNKNLIKEVQRKSKIIQNYAMETGAARCKRKSGGPMSPSFEDQPTLDGYSQSLYLQPSNGMTLELSLEMNKKYQAVLEDILLQNITLKENMKTLGDEISKLKLTST